MRRTRWLAPALLLATAHADSSVAPLKTRSAPEVLLDGVLKAAADASQVDETSPVKTMVTQWAKPPVDVPRGIRNFEGSGTVLRTGLTYGLLNLAGYEVVYSDPSLPHVAGMAVATLAFIDEFNQANLEKAFEKLTGQPLVKKRTKRGTQVLLAYNPAGVQAAFDRFYVKPTATVLGVKSSVVYNTLFKQFVATKAEATANVLARPGFLASKSKDYLAHWNTDAEFSGAGYQWKLVEKDKSLENEPRLVGTMLRRHADGTLPVLLKITRTILKDYDPDTFAKVGAKLTPR